MGVFTKDSDKTINDEEEFNVPESETATNIASQPLQAKPKEVSLALIIFKF